MSVVPGVKNWIKSNKGILKSRKNQKCSKIVNDTPRKGTKCLEKENSLQITGLSGRKYKDILGQVKNHKNTDILP